MDLFKNIKNAVREDITSFVLSAISALITLLTLIIYVVCYTGTSSFSLFPCLSLIVSLLIYIVCSLFLNLNIGKYFKFIFDLVALCCFIYGIYYYVSVVLVGIDLDSFSFEFIISTILFLTNFIYSFVLLFIKEKKEYKTKFITLSKVLSSSLVTIFALMQTTFVITNENKNVISKALGQKDYEIKNVSDDKEDTEYYKSKYSDLSELVNDGKKLVEEVELNGAVLLKNDNSALPLRKSSNVSLFSLGSVSPAYGGSGSSAASNPITPISFKNGLNEVGINVNEILFNFYKSKEATYKPVNYMIKDVPFSEIQANSNVISSFSSYGDAAIVVLKRIRGEHNDPSFNSSSCDGENGNYLALNNTEKELFSSLAALKGTTFNKIVVILNSPNQIETEFLDNPDYKIDAAMWIGTVGVTGFSAVGKLLTGEVSPSGKLSDTYWKKHIYNPSMANFGSETYPNASSFSDLPKKTGTDSYTSMQYDKYVAYQEGIYVGYKYTETRYYDVVSNKEHAGTFNYDEQISYPFGYGLSYTDFEYSNFKVNYKSSTDTYEASIDVKNIGNTYSGREVVEFYLNKPYTEYDIENNIEKAAVELVGYAKTNVLSPKESQTLTISIDRRSLSSYDAYNKQTYILDIGDYYLIAASNAHSATINLLTNDGYLANGNTSLVKKIETISSLDDKTYSKTKNTKYKINNLFNNLDMNLYENKGDNHITYMSRNNWEATLPRDVNDNVVLNLTRGMVDDIIIQETSDHIAPDDVSYPNYGVNHNLQLIDMRVDSNGNIIPFNSESWDEFMDQLTYEEIVSLITTGLRKTGTLSSIGKPSTVEHNGPNGITEKYSSGVSGIAYKINENGEYKDYTDYESLSNCSPVYYPSLSILASTFDEDIASRVGEMIGEDALWAGYNGLYGIGVNMHRTAFDGRNFEYYSEDSFLSGKQATNVVISLQAKGCNAYVKHLAGYEQQEYRVGLNVWCNEQAYREIYLKPFQMAIEDGHAMNAMTSYTRVGVTLCPASYSLITEFLRNECGMEGLVVSDMWKNRYLDRQLPNCLMAGLDIPDGDISDTSIYDTFREGYGEVANQMRLAAKRICYATVHSNAMNDISSSTRMYSITPLWQQIVIGLDIAFGVLAAISSFAFIFFVIKRRKEIK